MDITLPRGDIKHIKFSVTNRDGTKVVDFDEIYFTVKKDFKQIDYLIQKRLSQNTIKKGEDDYFYFTIEPSDTDNLKYGSYVFDIELVKDNSIKQTTVGMLIVTNEVTFINNEG